MHSDLIFDKLNLTWRLSKISYLSEEADLGKLAISLSSWNLCSNSAELLSHESSSVVKSGLWRAIHCNLSHIFSKHNKTKQCFISIGSRCNWPCRTLRSLRVFYVKFHRKSFIQYRPSSPWWHGWLHWGVRAKTPWHLGAPESTSSLIQQADVLQDLVCKLHYRDLPYSPAVSFSAFYVTAHGGNKSTEPAALYT